MHPDELLAALRRQPFQSFRVHVSDGSSYEVRHPEMMLVTRHTAYVALPGKTPESVPKKAVTIALLHVSRIETLAAAPKGNGQ